MHELEGHRAASWSHSYNAQCWAEARDHAATYVDRLVSRLPGAAGPLRDAHSAYRTVADSLRSVAERFPWNSEFDPQPIEDNDAIAHTLEDLTTARDAEVRANLALGFALTTSNAEG